MLTPLPSSLLPSSQGGGGQHGVRQRALRSLERYFYLILFNYYLHEQVGPGVRRLTPPSPGAPAALPTTVNDMGSMGTPMGLGRRVGTCVLVLEEGGCGGDKERPR